MNQTIKQEIKNLKKEVKALEESKKLLLNLLQKVQSRNRQEDEDNEETKVKYPLLVCVIFALIFASCSRQSCPTTDKKFFTRGVKSSGTLYKGYPSTKGNPIWKKH